jgi:hypothetical protein
MTIHANTATRRPTKAVTGEQDDAFAAGFTEADCLDVWQVPDSAVLMTETCCIADELAGTCWLALLVLFLQWFMLCLCP